MKIVTEYWAKPIPDRSHDWCAWDDSTCNGEPGDFGWGATEQRAIDDLKEKLEDRQ